MNKKYKTTIIIELTDEKIEEIKNNFDEDFDEDDLDNACYDLAQEIALECEQGGSYDDNVNVYFADSILFVDKV